MLELNLSKNVRKIALQARISPSGATYKILVIELMNGARIEKLIDDKMRVVIRILGS